VKAAVAARDCGAQAYEARRAARAAARATASTKNGSTDASTSSSGMTDLQLITAVSEIDVGGAAGSVTEVETEVDAEESCTELGDNTECDGSDMDCDDDVDMITDVSTAVADDDTGIDTDLSTTTAATVAAVDAEVITECVQQQQ
jgi:hypothetical protein